MKKSVKLKLSRETLRYLSEPKLAEVEGGGFPPVNPSMYNSCIASACGCSVYCTGTL